jgi:hypothetical protein
VSKQYKQEMQDSDQKDAYMIVDMNQVELAASNGRSLVLSCRLAGQTKANGDDKKGVHLLEDHSFRLHGIGSLFRLSRTNNTKTKQIEMFQPGFF